MHEIKVELHNESPVARVNDNHGEPVVMSLDEAIAVQIIGESISEIGLTSDDICVERRSDNYLSVILCNNDDFCRVKMGVRSKWLSLRIFGEVADLFRNDTRFTDLKNKNLEHWKVPLESPFDLSQHYDLIQSSCKNSLANIEI